MNEPYDPLALYKAAVAHRERKRRQEARRRRQMARKCLWIIAAVAYILFLCAIAFFVYR